MPPKALIRVLAVLLPLLLLAPACTDDGDGSGAEPGGGGSGSTADASIDYEEIGLWDDGPCDESRAPLKIGLMTVFESPVLSLAEHAWALEAAADAFNDRGGANGACIEVHACDDGGTVDQSIDCVREIDEAGVVATVNDTGIAGQDEVAAAMSEAGIPRVATNVTPSDWADPNAFPIDAASTGGVFVLPQALVDAGATDLAIVRVDQAAATALLGFLDGVYDEEVTFSADLPVPSGTTDYSQFTLAAEDRGAEGLVLALGEAEASQVIRAAQQLDTEMLIGNLAFTHASTAELDDFAKQMVNVAPFAPATADLPVYAALRADLAASDEKELQPEHLKISAMRSWIGLYALLRMIRDSGMQEFTRQGVTDMLNAATDVPMLGIFGDETWTPNLTRAGAFARTGIDRFAVYRWDPDSRAAGYDGNFVESGSINLGEVLCGSPLGADPPC